MNTRPTRTPTRFGSMRARNARAASERNARAAPVTKSVSPRTRWSCSAGLSGWVESMVGDSLVPWGGLRVFDTNRDEARGERGRKRAVALVRAGRGGYGARPRMDAGISDGSGGAGVSDPRMALLAFFV